MRPGRPRLGLVLLAALILVATAAVHANLSPEAPLAAVATVRAGLALSALATIVGVWDLLAGAPS